jgi:hypothetical protein
VSVFGSFGAQYALGRKFAVFGEAGVGFTDQETSPNAQESAFDIIPKINSHTWGTRAAGGVVFYF